SAPLHLLPDQLVHSAQDVISRQPGGIEAPCVTRRDPRRTGPGAVTLIARTQLGGHVGRNVRNRTAPYFLLIKPPLLPYDRIGVEENLEIGVRKNFTLGLCDESFEFLPGDFLFLLARGEPAVFPADLEPRVPEGRAFTFH